MVLLSIALAERMNLPYFEEAVLPQLWQALKEIVTAPYRHTDMIWIVTPLIIALLFMEFYFGRYKKEKLGWNSAVANSLVLIFVSLDLFRSIYGRFEASLSQIFTQNAAYTVVAALIAVEGFTILYLNFFHKLPKSVAFSVSSCLPVNLTAYFAVVFVYSKMSLNIYTAVSFLLIFVALLIIFDIIHLVEPEYREEYKGTILSRLFSRVFRPLENEKKGVRVDRKKYDVVELSALIKKIFKSPDAGKVRKK